MPEFVFVQKLLCGTNDLSLLGFSDSFNTATEACIISVTNFYEYDGIMMFHNEIYFSEFGAIVLGN